MAILFYTPRERPYGCFSNFSGYGFELDGLWWSTSEHYFQAQKFIGTPGFERVHQARTPMDAATIGRDRSLSLRTDWEQVKDTVMRKAVLRKFETHAELREILLSTGTNDIIENAPNDYYWGCGADGNGKNMLGQILVEVRAILQAHQK